MAAALACSGFAAAPIECVNVMDYGALANGEVDDTPAVQQALDAAVEKGGICFLPAGSYRLDASVTVPAGVTLKGAYDGIPHPMHSIGTVLHLYGGKGNPDAEPAIILDFNASIRNVLIHYPEQQAPPEVIPYPWAIQIRGQMCQVVEVAMTNPYRAIDAGTYVNELHVIRDVYACPLNIGIYISNCFVIFAKQGFLFDDFGHGSGNGLVTQSGSDLGPVAVQVNKTQTHAGVQFSNCQLISTVRIGPENTGPVKISNSGFWVIEETLEQVVNEGSGTLILNACHFSDWDMPNKGAACVRATNGRLILSQCDFSRPRTGLITTPKNAVSLEPGFIAGTVTGCLFHQDLISNTSTGKLELAANVFEKEAQSTDLGTLTLKSLCAKYEVAVAEVLAILKQHGIDAGPNSTLEAIAEESGMSPAELFALLADNL